VERLRGGLRSEDGAAAELSLEPTRDGKELNGKLLRNTRRRLDDILDGREAVA